MLLLSVVFLLYSSVGNLGEHLLEAIDDLDACLEGTALQAVAQVADQRG